MMSNRCSDPQSEREIVWLEDVSGYRYVRELVNMNYSRTRKPTWRSRAGRLVGYATLTKATRSTYGIFYRRCFWLADHDPYEGGGCPCEAVDPATVRPNEPAQCTDRCAGDEPAENRQDQASQP